MSSVKNYQLNHILGQGSFATVHQVLRNQDHKTFALKKINFQNITLKDKQNALNQVRVLASLNNEHIISFESAFYDQQDQSLSIVMEFAQNGDLASKIKQARQNNTQIQENQIWRIVSHIAKGLKCLHANNIIHRDLKAANIFQTKDKIFKIGDFNISKIIKSKNGLAETQTGTPFYACPQIWQNQKYNIKSDIWSLGIITYELAALELPFPASQASQLYSKIHKGSYNRIPSNYSDQLFNLINQLLSAQSQKRPGAQQIIAKCLFHNSNIKKNVPLKVISKKNVLLQTIDMKDINNLDQLLSKNKTSVIRRKSKIFDQFNKQNMDVQNRQRIKTLLDQNLYRFRQKLFSLRENKESQIFKIKPQIKQIDRGMNISRIISSSSKTDRMINIQGKLRPSKLPSVRPISKN